MAGQIQPAGHILPTPALENGIKRFSIWWLRYCIPSPYYQLKEKVSVLQGTGFKSTRMVIKTVELVTVYLKSIFARSTIIDLVTTNHGLQQECQIYSPWHGSGSQSCFTQIVELPEGPGIWRQGGAGIRTTTEFPSAKSHWRCVSVAGGQVTTALTPHYRSPHPCHCSPHHCQVQVCPVRVLSV